MKGLKMFYYVYMMTNNANTVLYTGVTNDLRRRVFEHKSEKIPGFTKTYKAHKLVYFDCTTDINEAIAREKQIKGWSRAKKNAIVCQMNPQWNDLWNEIKD